VIDSKKVFSIPNDVQVTAHYVLNVTTSCPGKITLDGSTEQTKFYSRYEGVLFQPNIFLRLPAARGAVEAIATQSVLECNEQGLFDFWETIFSTDEMKVGSDDYILWQGQQIDMADLMDRRFEDENVDWEFFGQQGDDIEEIEVVEGPLITISGAGLSAEKLTPQAILALLPQEQHVPQDTQAPHQRQGLWARLFGKR
jgi:hypothetical protein